MSGCSDCENCLAREDEKVFCDAKNDWCKFVGDYDKCNNYSPRFTPERYGDEEER